MTYASKKTQTIKKLFKIPTLVGFLISITLFSAINNQPVYASEHEEDDIIDQICESEQSMYEWIASIKDFDITRTVNNQLTEALTGSLTMITTGTNNETIHKCGAFYASVLDTSNGPLTEISEACEMDDDELNACIEIAAMYGDSTDGEGQIDGTGYYFPRPKYTRGSMLAMSNALDKTTKEPLPVNLAYYTNRQLENVPYAGTAFAQSPSSFRGPFLEITYDLWRVVRDMAYGVMALVMLVVGIMIMTRKKVNPQTMVTVQYAIPRIILALGLITFSYPIGATLASIAWAFRTSITLIVYDAIGAGSSVATVINNAATLGVVPTIITLVTSAIISIGVGVFSIIIGGIALLLAIAFRIAVSIRVLLVYIKMVMLVITSPAYFALGAIPGYEDNTTKWFKLAGSKILAILGMRMIIAMTNSVLFIVTVGILSDVTGGETPILTGGMSAMMPFVGPLILAFGYYQAMQLPKKLDAMILDKKR